MLALEQRVEFQSRNSSRRSMDMIVDVVADGGNCWVKVFTRKRKALHKKWLGKRNE